MAGRKWTLILGIGAVAALGSFIELALPQLRFSYVSSELRVALETAQMLIAVLVTHLLYGRFRRTHPLGDLLLAYGMGMFAAANLFFVVVPVLDPSRGLLVYETWAPLLIRVVGSTSIAYAAWARPRPYNALGAGVKLLSAHLVSMLVVLGGVAALSGRLPAGVEATVTPRSSDAVLESHPVLLVAQVLLIVLHWLAAGGFARQTVTGDPLTTAFAVGFVIAGFSRVNFFLEPSVYTTVVRTGDLLRLSSYLALLVGAEREIHSYWSRLAGAAVAEERRRTARELHDGLVQELSFIRSRTAGFAAGPPDRLTLEQVSGAADRALAESRLAVQALSAQKTDDPAAALRRAAEEVAVRAGMAVHTEAPDRLHLPAEVTEALARIVREACSNAARHGGAKAVSISLEHSKRSGLYLTITDDGAGFDAGGATSTGGFGLTSMRERATVLGGELRVSSSPGHGTRIEVVVPRVR